MTVRDGGHITGEREHLLGISDEQPDRRRPHDTPTSLGVVERPISGAALTGVQGRQARVARGTAVMQALLGHEPAVRIVAAERRAGLGPRDTLGVQPPEISVVHNARCVANALGPRPDRCANQSFGSEQGHLRGVSDRSDTVQYPVTPLGPSRERISASDQNSTGAPRASPTAPASRHPRKRSRAFTGQTVPVHLRQWRGRTPTASGTTGHWPLTAELSLSYDV